MFPLRRYHYRSGTDFVHMEYLPFMSLQVGNGRKFNDYAESV